MFHVNDIDMNVRSSPLRGWCSGRRRALLLALSLPGVSVACGSGQPSTRRDAAAVDAPAVDAAGVDGACSAERVERCAYTPAARYGQQPLLTREVTYTDVLGEARTVEITLARPDGAPTPWPVVVWSHGGLSGVMSSARVGDEWREIFTGAGYAFLGIAHRPRTDASRGRLCVHFGVTDMAECARVKYLHYDRPHDFAAVLDYVTAQSTGALAGVLDLGHLMYAGHSAGTGSGSIVAGATRSVFGQPQTAPDSRPIAFLGASMEGAGDDGFGEGAFDAITAPHLTLSGVGDETSDSTAPPRRLPFERMRPGDKYRLWITDAAARHGTFNHEATVCPDYAASHRIDASRCGAYLRWLESAALAFADAYLRDRPEARAWLASDAVTVMSAGVAEWARR